MAWGDWRRHDSGLVARGGDIEQGNHHVLVHTETGQVRNSISSETTKQEDHDLPQAHGDNRGVWRVWCVSCHVASWEIFIFNIVLRMRKEDTDSTYLYTTVQSYQPPAVSHVDYRVQSCIPLP